MNDFGDMEPQVINEPKKNNYLNNVDEMECNEEKKENQLSLAERVFAKLLTDPDNSLCFDCGQTNSFYVSVNQGVFICVNCAYGIHRLHYGVEVSYIKSIFKDPWNHQQLRALIHSGNK